MESKKSFFYELACTGINCPMRSSCQLHQNMSFKSVTRNVIAPPFTKDADGKFLSCDKFNKVK